MRVHSKCEPILGRVKGFQQLYLKSQLVLATIVEEARKNLCRPLGPMSISQRFPRVPLRFTLGQLLTAPPALIMGELQFFILLK
jgi:hypothetical protein